MTGKQSRGEACTMAGFCTALRPLARAWGRVAGGGARHGTLTPEARRLARAAVRWRRRRVTRPALWIHCARAISDSPPPDGVPLVPVARA